MQSSSRHKKEHAHTDLSCSSSSQSHYTSNSQQSPTSTSASSAVRVPDVSKHWQQSGDSGWNRSLPLINNTRLSTTTTAAVSSPSLPHLPPVTSSAPSLLQSRFYSASSSSTAMPPSSVPTSAPHLFQPYPTLSRSGTYLYNSGYSRASGISKPPSRPRLTTTLWEDESTICYQVDCRGICVARRQDNNMINGTKLLNVAGMSRGKRDGILKNERGRVVVKVGAMHLKGVWIPFLRAKTLANQFKILDILYPIFSDDPASYLYPSHLHQMNRFNSSISSSNHHFNNEKSSNHNPLYKAYPTSASALDLFTTAARGSNSVIDDIVPQVNDTYSIYHHQQQQKEEPRGTNNSNLICSQQQQQQYQGFQNQQQPDISTTNVKSPSFLTDYSTVSINHNQDSVQKRLNYRHNQDQQGTSNMTRPAASHEAYGTSSQHNSYYRNDTCNSTVNNMTSPISSSTSNSDIMYKPTIATTTAVSSPSTSPSAASSHTTIIANTKNMSKSYW
ncbi:hypothetical protein [Parasitella parasitica]|uniref:HTH APSES-type domain-containing protein n=1 Tax=Parasitella parasitica TaxID=35722 RepID=A0A0B7N8K0_9FUNG|nr:hypothetical protein [Parasitella parasitica]